MTEHDAFLQTIIESPDDDALRLVFADWLDEHGEAERAELIRLQCALNSLPPESPEVVPSKERVTLLLRAHQDDFLEPLTRIGLRFGTETLYPQTWNECVIAHLTATFRRGFVEEITVAGRENLRTFLGHAGALFRLTPLRHLEVTQVSGWDQSYDQGFPIGCYTPMIDPPCVEDLRALVHLPELAQLRTLLLRLDIRREEARVLVDSPVLTDQTELLLYPGERSQGGGPEDHQEIEHILGARFGASVRWCG
jgi:uncharacterized protein (TIGR02996 family)